jgi:hypothetical protein
MSKFLYKIFTKNGVFTDKNQNYVIHLNNIYSKNYGVLIGLFDNEGNNQI